MSRFRVLLVPALFGVILLTIAIVTRSGKFARENPGQPINSAMREAMNMMNLDPDVEAMIGLRQAPTAFCSGMAEVVGLCSSMYSWRVLSSGWVGVGAG